MLIWAIFKSYIPGEQECDTMFKITIWIVKFHITWLNSTVNSASDNGFSGNAYPRSIADVDFNTWAPATHKDQNLFLSSHV